MPVCQRQNRGDSVASVNWLVALLLSLLDSFIAAHTPLEEKQCGQLSEIGVIHNGVKDLNKDVFTGVLTRCTPAFLLATLV